MNGLTPEERAEFYEQARIIHENTGQSLEAVMSSLAAMHPVARRQAAESRQRVREGAERLAASRAEGDAA